MTRSGKLTDITLKQKTMVMTTVMMTMMTNNNNDDDDDVGGDYDWQDSVLMLFLLL